MYRRILFIHLMMLLSVSLFAQKVGVRTSATMWLTTTPNIEVNYTLNNKVTLHLPVLYNPFVFKDNSRFQQLTTMPGMRYWFNTAHAQAFMSAYGIATRYHIGGWFGMDYRYDGKGFGFGLGGGYSWILTERLNIEAELGIGLIHAEYDKCGWASNSKRYAHEKGMRIAPCKCDISLVYFF